MTKDAMKAVEAEMTDPFTAANFRRGIEIYRGQEAMHQNEAYRAQGRAEAIEALLRQKLDMEAKAAASAKAAAEAAQPSDNTIPASIAANAQKTQAAS